MHYMLPGFEQEMSSQFFYYMTEISIVYGYKRDS